MPRKLELTFQKGANGRTGRWKKFYRGKSHYLGNARSKSDLESYRSALTNWKRLKSQLDTEAIEKRDPLQCEYDDVIAEWELVLSWAVENREHNEAALARAKIEELNERRSKRKPEPVTHTDRLWSRFRPDDEKLREIAEIAAQAKVDWGELHKTMFPRGLPVMKRPSRDMFWTTSKEERVWQDRLELQAKRSSPDRGNSLASWKATYLASQQQRVDAGDLSAGRFVSVRAALDYFASWSGGKTDVAAIDAQMLTRFHAALLQLIASEECASGYARDRLSTVRSFIRWLWEQEAIEAVPKNLDSKQLRISRKATTPQTFEIDEVKTMLESASRRTRLYLLLALNCGMTQKDISDLLQTQVAWRTGTITRKRSKTQSHESVPTVTYRLWPETLELLREFRSESEVVLVNENGTRLRRDRVDASGQYKKSDNIKSAFTRLQTKLSITKPFKLLRATSATLLESNERFRGLDDLFLGHAPKTIAEKHYSATSSSALDDALAFLRGQYGLIDV